MHADDVWAQLVRTHRELGIHAKNPEIPVHEPVAAVLACADARVAPNLLFGRDPGELFVVRVAGNIPDASAVASLDYAVGHLGVPLVIVLGHTSCGAVTAAVDETIHAPHLLPVLDPIRATLAGAAYDGPDEASAINVGRSLRRLAESYGPVGRAFRAGELSLRGAVHDLGSGSLTEVEGPRNPPA